MRVLVIGSGAREHALCVALSSDAQVDAVGCAPGNAGTRAVAENTPVDVTDPVAVASVATAWGADLVVIGPEVPLVAGAADAVRDAGIACFGPSAEAAQLEGEARRQLLRVDARARAQQRSQTRAFFRAVRDQPNRQRPGP